MGADRVAFDVGVADERLRSEGTATENARRKPKARGRD
jgi:hypothetical protein